MHFKINLLMANYRDNANIHTHVLICNIVMRAHVPALGCPDLEPSPLAWIERDGNKATIGCQNTRPTWELTCQDNKWVGGVGNCSTEGEARFYYPLYSPATNYRPIRPADFKRATCLGNICVSPRYY